MRLVLLQLLALTATRAFTLGGGASVAIGQPTQRFMTPLTAEAPSLRPGAVTMRCRTNLKKEKRLRNRINAFRFKKGTFNKFSRGPPRRDDSPTNEEDATFYSMVFMHDTTQASSAEAEAKEAQSA